MGGGRELIVSWISGGGREAFVLREEAELPGCL